MDTAECQTMNFDPCGVSIARDGTLFVADQSNHCIRSVQGWIAANKAMPMERAPEQLVSELP